MNSQVYVTPAQIQTITTTFAAYEGDLYLDTTNNDYYIGLTHGILVKIGDTLDERIDTLIHIGDSILIIEGGDSLYLPFKDNDWFKEGTTSSPSSIADNIYTEGNLRFDAYKNSRSDDTTAFLNYLYTDTNGNLKSARREITPPAVALNVSVTSVGNTFNYYNHYATQLTNIGLTPIPLANLDFYVLYFDTTVFANVSINSSGILMYDVIATNSDSHRVIDVRFYTK